jgi:D-alanyl-lipoteichoic acid acyltransferase DltB (MBOAT superfamily)
MLVFGFVCLAWVFFRAKSLHDAWLVLSGICTTPWVDPKFPIPMAILIFAIWTYQFLYTSENRGRRLVEWAPVRAGLAVAMLLYLMIVAQPTSQQFIYFQF